MTDNPIEGGNIGPHLRAYIERVERIEGERKELSNDIADIYAEARGTGFDVPAIKAIVSERRKDPEKRKSHEAIVDLYKAALGMVE